MDSNLEQIPKVLALYLQISQYPILGHLIRKRMREELFERGVITPQQFEQEVKDKAKLSQQREGTPPGQDTDEIWHERRAQIREHLTDFYFAYNLPHALFEDILQNVLAGRMPDRPDVLPFNPELAPRPFLIAQAKEYAALPPEQQSRIKHHQEEITVVLVKRMISDQMDFVRLAKKFLAAEDFEMIYGRRIGTGKIGGKTAGMILACEILRQDDPADEIDLHGRIVIPDSYFIGANVFYDALLPQVAGEKKVDSVSGLGYALGYLGGGLLFLINVLMVTQPALFGLSGKAQAVRYSFLTVALWWGGFTVFTIVWVKEKSEGEAVPLGKKAVSEGFRQFISTFRKVRHLKTVFLFLCAYWLYIDGVDTIVRMAVDYGLSLGFKDTDLITALLITQFVGFPAALLFGALGERWSARKSIFLGIGVYLVVTVWGAFITKKSEFYLLAVMIGCVQGGVQALSRSFYSRIIPRRRAGEFYGFYNMLGKFAAIAGPALMGATALLARRLLNVEGASDSETLEASRTAARWGLASVSLLFLSGGVLFFFVDEKKGRAEARFFEGDEEERPYVSGAS